MATFNLFHFRPRRRPDTRGPLFRSALAAVACTTTLSVVAPVTPAVAAEKDPAAVIDDLTAKLSSGSASIGDLAGALAGVEDEIARIEGEIGKYRATVNQALVDLQDARSESLQAKNGTKAAHEELEKAQEDFEKAKEKLEELSRTAYRRANTSEAVTNASGQDARGDMLDRRAYLRDQAEDQKKRVDELDRVRTEKANKESQLRKAEELADRRVDRAEKAEKTAREQLADSESGIEETLAERAELAEKQEAAQNAIDDARDGDAGKADTEKTDEASDKPTVEPYAAGPKDDAKEEHPSSTGRSSSNISDEQKQELLDAAFEAAATIVADSQPDHAALDETADDGSSIPAIQFNGSPDGDKQALVDASSSLSADLSSLLGGNDSASDAEDEKTTEQQGITNAATGADEELVDDLDGVLEDLDTSESVTEEAEEEVADKSRSEKIEAVIDRAMSQIGVPYAWGGGDANGPTRGINDGGYADSYGDYGKVGFDCSGLVLYAFAAAGISLPHFTGYQYQRGTKVDPSEMQRGDLIFYGPNGNQHVAIYLGDGQMLEAPQSGATVSVNPVRQAGMSTYAVRII